MSGVLPLKLMEKHAVATEKNQYLNIFPKRIEIFLQKYVGHIIIKQTRSHGEYLVSIFFVIK